MNKSWRQRLRRLRFICGGLICVALIAVAVMIGLVQALLPLAAHYPDRVARLISSRVHKPVRFSSLEGRWQASGPLLVLHDVRIGATSGQALKFPVADVKIDFGAWLRPQRRLFNLRVANLHLDLKRDRQGQWNVAGLGASGKSKQPLDLSQLPGNLWLDHLQLNISDAQSGQAWRLQADTLRVSNGGGRLRFAGRVRRDGVAHALDVIGRLDTERHAGRLYVGGQDIDVGKLLSGLHLQSRTLDAGHGDFTFWLGWRDGQIVAQSGRVHLNDLRMHGPVGSTRVGHLQARFDFSRTAHGTRVRFASADGGAAWVRINAKDGVRKIQARAQHLQLGSLAPLLAQAPGISTSLTTWLAGAKPRGRMDKADVRWTSAHGIESLDARFSKLQADPVAGHPGVGPLDGRLLGDARAMVLQLPQQATRLRLPATFRKPIALTKLSGDVTAWRDQRAWHVGTDALNFSGQGFSGQARGDVRIADAAGAPFADLFVTLDHVDIPTARQFLPVDALPPRTLAWLDRGLVAGTLTRADVVLHGDLADWPFRHHRGRFEARGVISGLTLDYNRHWPQAKGVDAVASFVDDSMLVTTDAGRSLGVKTRKVVASIPDFHDAPLVLTVQGSGRGADLLNFARNSPIASRQADALHQLKLGGKGDFDFSLVMPLHDSQNFTLAGTARLQDADVANADWGLQLGKLDGELHFDGHGLSGHDLVTNFNGVPSKLDLELGSGATGDPNKPVRATLRGHYDIATLVRGRASLQMLKQVAHGASDFTIGFDITNEDNGSMRQTLNVDSDLQGVALDLPAPLDKRTNTRLPLHVGLQLPVDAGRLQISLGDLAQIRALLPAGDGKPLALAARFGAVAPSNLPPSGIRVRGYSPNLDVSGWVKRALSVQGGKGSGTQLSSVDVRADNAQLFGATFKNLHMSLQPQPGQLRMNLDSPGMKGTLTMPTRDLPKRGITARMQRLYWPDDTAEAKQHAASAPEVKKIDYAATGIDPAALPPLHISVDDLRLGQAHLGQARFESWPTEHSMHIDLLRTHTSDVQITARGDWKGDAASSHTHMKIDFGAKNLGSLLNTLGFSGLFDGGRTQVHLDASWPGEPSALALERMNGQLKLEVSKGRIPEVQPGVGRLLGLMAVTELPRRLSLDFGDVFGKGFGFDSIKGQFQLDDGMAETRGLKLKGSAADITISGRTNLRAKTYDEKILVVPHVGNSLPIVGALAGGPLGAAAGLAVQGLLGHGLNKAASAHYSLTGPWSKPKMTKLGDKDRPAKTTPDTPSS